MLKNITSAILILLLFSTYQCQSRKKIKTTHKKIDTTTMVKSPQKSPDGIINLAEGQSYFVEDGKFNIRFREVTEDNRCPENARCMQQGWASIWLTATGIHSRPIDLKVQTIDNESLHLSRTVNYKGYIITLETIKPNLNTSTDLAKLKGKYEIGITVSKIPETISPATTK